MPLLDDVTSEGGGGGGRAATVRADAGRRLTSPVCKPVAPAPANDGAAGVPCSIHA
jgi:hypothetical protein